MKNLVRLNSVLIPGQSVDAIAVDPTKIEAIFWSSSEDFPAGGCATIVLRDGLKVQWLVSRSEYEGFLDTLNPFHKATRVGPCAN